MKSRFIAVYSFEKHSSETLSDLDKCYLYLKDYELKYGIKQFEEKATETDVKPKLADLRLDVSEGLVSLVVISSLTRLANTKNGLKYYLNLFKETKTGLISLKEDIVIGFEDCCM